MRAHLIGHPPGPQNLQLIRVVRHAGFAGVRRRKDVQSGFLEATCLLNGRRFTVQWQKRPALEIAYQGVPSELIKINPSGRAFPTLGFWRLGAEHTAWLCAGPKDDPRERVSLPEDHFDEMLDALIASLPQKVTGIAPATPPASRSLWSRWQDLWTGR